MHPVVQLKTTLEKHSDELRVQYGCGYTVKQTSGNTLNDAIQEIDANHPVLVHLMQDLSYMSSNPFDKNNFSVQKLVVGGGPHTAELIGVDTKNVTLIDPAYPSVGSPNNLPQPALHVMPIQDFLDLWGRPSNINLYTKPNTMTVLVPDPICAPVNTVTPTATVSPTNTPTVTPSSTATSSPTNTPTVTPTPKP
jgi:hypothetical protein